MLSLFSILKKAAAYSMEALVNIYQAKRRNFSEESNLRSHRPEKLKHQMILIFTAFLRREHTRVSVGHASR